MREGLRVGERVSDATNIQDTGGAQGEVHVVSGREDEGGVAGGERVSDATNIQDTGGAQGECRDNDDGDDDDDGNRD